ncbi:MAG: amino acid ABC transporter permease [Erysipelotrichaceae bacterium]|nr:amino acid ABC transporter permease [Erysipelotrichaceae bacterium]
MIMDLTEIIDVAIKYWDIFLEGAWGTLQLSFITVFLGSLLGIFVSLGKMSKFKPLSAVCSFYVNLIRGTPMLVQLYIFTFFVPQFFTGLKSLNLSDYFYVVFSLVINSSAYVSEIIRSGIQAVDPGQQEAAKSLGLTDYHAFTKIVLPQAVKNILPALGNEFITMIKETSLASTFYINELMRTRTILMSTYFLSWQPLFVVAIIYFIMTSVLSKGVQLLERRLMLSD